MSHRSRPLPAAVVTAALLVVVTLAPARPAAAGAGKKCSAAQGQLFIDQGRYDQAIREFTCVIDAQPTEVEGYRGRIEAKVLLGRYSDAVGDYARVTAFVLPVHPDAPDTIHAGYSARLAIAPQNIAALTGASFARWWYFQYPAAIHLLQQLLDIVPNDLYGNLFRGSSRLLSGANKAAGIPDLEHAIALAPDNPHVRFIVADAYTYGLPDPNRAFAEASAALALGLATPRIYAILASAYAAFGDEAAAASNIKTHIDLVTTELVAAPPLAPGGSLTVGLVPGRTCEIPVAAIAGQTVSIRTSSPDFWDSIIVLLAPDGSPAVGSDDFFKYFAGFDWVASSTGTYHLLATSFESVNTGGLIVTR